MPSLEQLSGIATRYRAPSACPDAPVPCVAICPLGLDVPGLMSDLISGDFAAALRRFRDCIPFPSICAHLCDHPCQPVCARAMDARPVPIPFLERAIVRLGRDRDESRCAPDTGSRVAIVGAGPAGLTAAHCLRRLGHEITIFHSGRRPCDSARRIPDFRLPRGTLDSEVARIMDQGINLKSGFSMGRDFTLDDLKADGFQAVVLAFGFPGVVPDHIPGDELSGVMSAADFLDQAAEQDSPAPLGNVVVAGSTITAVDAARLAARMGAESVTLVLCHSLAAMSIPAAEIQRAEADGVRPVFLARPIAFEGRGRRLESALFQKVAPPSADVASGRHAVGIPGTEFRLPARLVLLAPRGHGMPDQRALEGLPSDVDGSVIRDESSAMTCRPGVFVCGELAGHGGHAVKAMGDGRRVAHAVDVWLGGTSSQPATIEQIRGNARRRTSRPGTPRPQWESVALFDALLEGQDSDALASRAMREAIRCLRCRGRAAQEERLFLREVTAPT